MKNDYFPERLRFVGKLLISWFKRGPLRGEGTVNPWGDW